MPTQCPTLERETVIAAHTAGLANLAMGSPSNHTSPTHSTYYRTRTLTYMLSTLNDPDPIGLHSASPSFLHPGYFLNGIVYSFEPQLASHT